MESDNMDLDLIVNGIPSTAAELEKLGFPAWESYGFPVMADILPRPQTTE